MSVLKVNKNKIVLCSDDKIILFNSDNNSTTQIELPTLELPHNLTQNQKNAIENERRTIQNTAFSKNREYFAVCLANKQLVVYNSEFQVIKNVLVQRSTSKIRFTTSGNVVIADKTGDVYLYNLQDEKPTELLGHLSMLLDVIVTDNEQYIITCDRDEKIRVSHFPGSYNIVSFCLGHEEFVTNLEFYKPDVLISSAGDGTLRFWDFLSGKQLKVINTNNYIKDKSILEKFSEYMDSETVEITSLPITNMKVRHFEDKTVIVVSLHNFNGLQVFQVTGDIDVELIQIIEISKILSFDLSDKLYVLTNCDIKLYEFKDKFYVEENQSLIEFYDNCKGIIKENVENISVLYKRKYDNVQEYQERKKLRIEQKKK